MKSYKHLLVLLKAEGRVKLILVAGVCGNNCFSYGCLRLETVCGIICVSSYGRRTKTGHSDN